MPVVRYVCAGNFGGRGVSAFTPAPPRTTSNFSIKNDRGYVVAQPGTQGIPVPWSWPGPGINQYSSDTSGGIGTGSRNQPPVFYPQLGYFVQQIYRGIGGVRVFSDNLMPVPATDPRRIPAGSVGPIAQAGTNMPPARPKRRLRNRQVAWPARAVRWPNANG